MELAIDLLLLDFAWGTRELHARTRGLVQGLVESARELKQAFSHLDLERIAVLPTLLAFTLGGALVGARAVEGIVGDGLHALLPNAAFATHLAAATALCAAAVLVWRFVPDLLDGAILRSSERGARAHARLEERLATRAPPRFPRLARARLLLQQKSRGKLLLFAALPLALASLGGQADLVGMLLRVGGP